MGAAATRRECAATGSRAAGGAARWTGVKRAVAILCLWVGSGCTALGLGTHEDRRAGAWPPLNADPKPATETTRAAQERVRRSLPFEDERDFELALRGRLAGGGPLRIEMDEPGDGAGEGVGDDDGGRPGEGAGDGAGGEPAWDMTRYDFIEGEAPPTVNPSLWRQARLNGIHGLFEVVDGIYQVRGYDLSNVSFVRGETGWIVIDPLITVESARAALALVDETLGARPVVAVIYSHSHVDHFGGVRGLVEPEDVAAGRVRIVAPEDFLEHAVSENVVAGNAMTRRAAYMFGRLLPAGPQGRVDTGLGKTTSLGRVSLLEPTDIVRETGTRLEIDGIEFVFQNTPGAEAPAEMMFFLPHRKAFFVAEEANAVMHNLYTLRGAQVRSGALWARWLDEAIALFGDELELVFGAHHWPRWGREEALDFLASQRDLYKYIHDQTLHLANLGLTPVEIADRIELPEALARRWSNRGYYGTLKHNARATYQLYLGWFDGNPAHLDPHPPVEAGRRYVALAGGAEALLEQARAAYAEGDYRWVAEVVNHLVFADPGNREARWLQADALEQLGYQAEAGPWRNFYLSAARDLRDPKGRRAPRVATTSADVLAAMPSRMLFDFLAVSLDGERAAEEAMTVELRFPDRDERWLLEIERGVLRHSSDRMVAGPTLRLTIPRDRFVALLQGQVKMTTLLRRGEAELEGGLLALRRFGLLFQQFSPDFEIVTP